MSAKPVALPPQLHACVNDFLAQANEMQKNYKYDAISASLLYAAARYNVHGYVHQGDGEWFESKDFVAYMTDLYKRMLEEQIVVLGSARAEGSQ